MPFSFNRFITQDILIVFYYIGAVIAPIVLYYYKGKILQYLQNKGFNLSFDFKNNKLVYIIFIVIFICMEICWRMFFEAMIGYFDIHNYLYEILKKDFN